MTEDAAPCRYVKNWAELGTTDTDRERERVKVFFSSEENVILGCVTRCNVTLKVNLQWGQ